MSSAELRRRMLEKRKSIASRDEKQKALVQKLVPFFLEAENPGMYIPLKDEADIYGLFEYLDGFLAPKVISGTEMIFLPADSLSEGAFGVSEPEIRDPSLLRLLKERETCRLNPEKAEQLKRKLEQYVPDVILVPMSVFHQTYRMGYGKGYYDRWIAAHPKTLTIGCAFDEQEAEFEPEPWDQPLDYIVTPTRILKGRGQEKVQTGKQGSKNQLS